MSSLNTYAKPAQVIALAAIIIANGAYLAKILPDYLIGDSYLAAATGANPPAIIVAASIVCDREADLPNWGSGSPAITATTSDSYLASHPGCRRASGWSFEWAGAYAQKAAGNKIGVAGPGWTTFGPTGSSGTASVSLDAYNARHDPVFRFIREVLQPGYVPFLSLSSTSTVSAEIYCAAPSGGYDDFTSLTILAGKTYYCVAFNAPSAGTAVGSGASAGSATGIANPPVAVIPATTTPPSIPAVTPCSAGGPCEGVPTMAQVYAAASAHAPGWNRLLLSYLLGPTYEQLHPGLSADARPYNYMPASKQPRSAAFGRIRPYEIGGPDYSDSDYWSTTAQVGYVPTSTDGTQAGLARLQTFAYYDHVFAESPRADYSAGRTGGLDPTANAIPNPKPEVMANVRGMGLLQNDALILYSNGTLGISGTQTGGGNMNLAVRFPSTKIPTSVAITSSNEFALVTIWDTAARKGQLAVIALEGKALPYHTMPYMGLINEGSFTDMKLLGYVDLPMQYPTSVGASLDSHWNGPSQTSGLDLGKLNASADTTRTNLYSGIWSSIVATKGYAIASSKSENKVTFVDLGPLVKSFRESWLSSAASFAATLASRGPGDNDFPKVFSANPSEMPQVGASYAVQDPTQVLAGQVVNRWSKERPKAYAASGNGMITIFDTSFYKVRTETSDKHIYPLSQLGSFYACKNPTNMNFARFTQQTALPGQPAGVNNIDVNATNDLLYIACRGDREVAEAVVWGGTGNIYRRFSDSRMKDPVAVGVADRGNILSIADFNGQKIFSFRIGNLVSRDGKTTYKPGADGTDAYELGGIMSLPGKPFSISEANVN